MTTETTSTPGSDLGEVTITREFDAPRELVFRAFVEPEQFVRFWGPVGTHVPIESVVIEPWVGGRFESVMKADDGSMEYPSKGVFVEISEPEVFAFSEAGSDVVSRGTLTDLGGGRCRLVIHQTNVPEAYRTPEALAGFNTSIDRLEEHLAAVTATNAAEVDGPITADGFSITRTFDAPRELVFAAWTEPAQFASWFGGAPSEVPVETVSLDVRVGGRWSLVLLAGPERTEMPFFGEYVEVDPPARLAMTMEDNTGAGTDAKELVTVTFTEVHGRTEMAFRQSGGNLPVEQYAATQHGWNAFFDQLAHDLAG